MDLGFQPLRYQRFVYAGSATCGPVVIRQAGPGYHGHLPSLRCVVSSLDEDLYRSSGNAEATASCFGFTLYVEMALRAVDGT